MVVQTERLGVARLDHFFSSVGWLFREQLVHDYGIDAHVEVVQNAYPTGNLIALQIKTGSSYFAESTEDAYIFRTEDKHINYWQGHALPVILVLYHPEDDLLLWQVVSEETVVSTGKGWKIAVPKNRLVDQDCLLALKRLNQPAPYLRKLNKLRLDAHWIRKLHDGEEIFVTFDDWVNKSLSRYQINLICEDGTHVWPTTYSPGMSVEDALEHFIPWANFEMDLDAHRIGAEAQWHAECYQSYDKELGIEIFTQNFDDWYVEPDGIVPCDFNGEVEIYRLQLSLNELGRAFLKVREYLEQQDQFEGRTFTVDKILP